MGTAGGVIERGDGERVTPAYVLRADAGRIPLADESVDLIVTSPPYFSLRSYRDEGEHFTGQIGSEAHPQEWLENLWAVMRECWRVLKPEGSCFVNLGDKRSGSRGHNNSGIAFGRPKSKMLLPHRFAIGCEDGLADPEGIGWIVRQDVVWAKRNSLPESVVDRCRDSHEFIFHLTKSERYYSAVDEIREPHLAPAHAPGNRKWASERQDGDRMETVWEHHPLGKLPGSVWPMASEPLLIPEWAQKKYSLPMHFAAFPTELPRRIILGWSPEGGVVLDPFGGTGTTAGVARVLGRVGVSVDLSSDYCRLARWRIEESGHFRKALQRTYSERQVALL